MVGGAVWARMARRVKIASIAPAAPRRCPVIDLVDDMATPEAASPSRRSTAPASMPSAMVEVPWALMYWMSEGPRPASFRAACMAR